MLHYNNAWPIHTLGANFHGVFIPGIGGNFGEKMAMKPPFKTSLYINNLCPTHSPAKNLAWGGLRVGRFKGTYNLEEVELWAIGRP